MGALLKLLTLLIAGTMLANFPYHDLWLAEGLTPVLDQKKIKIILLKQNASEKESKMFNAGI